MNFRDRTLSHRRIQIICTGQGEDGDVVVLAEDLCCLGDCFGRLSAERCAAFKAEERAGLVAGFDYSVGEKSELLARASWKMDSA